MENNIAFIDWQNLHLWTSTENWKVDFKRFWQNSACFLRWGLYKNGELFDRKWFT